jgi:hypothetical protein
MKPLYQRLESNKDEPPTLEFKAISASLLLSSAMLFIYGAAAAGYKGHQDLDRIQFIDFSTPADEVLLFLEGLTASGGGEVEPLCGQIIEVRREVQRLAGLVGRIKALHTSRAASGMGNICDESNVGVLL